MALSKRLKFEVMNRDGFICQYCGAKPPGVQLAVDHVVPQALGGTDDPSNLTTACRPCNEGKASSHPSAPTVAAVKERAAGYADAVHAAFAERESAMLETKATVGRLSEQWEEYGDPRRPADWGNGLEYFLRAGLSEAFILEAMAIAMTAEHIPWRNKWRYMCGVCHKTIKQVHDSVTADDAEPVAVAKPPEVATSDPWAEPPVQATDSNPYASEDPYEAAGDYLRWRQEDYPLERMRFTRPVSHKEMEQYGMRMMVLHDLDETECWREHDNDRTIHRARHRGCYDRDLMTFEASRRDLLPEKWDPAEDAEAGRPVARGESFCCECCLAERVAVWQIDYGQKYSTYLREARPRIALTMSNEEGAAEADYLERREAERRAKVRSF